MFLLSPGCNQLAGIAVLVLGLLASFSSAHAASFTVTNLADSGEGSLRQAITSAEESPGEDSIVFSPGLKGTLALARALPNIKSTIRITGPSTQGEGITIQGNNGQSLYGNLTLANLTFAKSTTTEGGVFSITGQLTINNCRFVGNQATSFNGGAIYNKGGTVMITNSTFSDNRAPSASMELGGGALFNIGKMTINRCTFTGNSALKGGVIYNLGTASLFITGSTFARNKAAQGGVIYNDMGSVSIKASTFANNRASEGGAIFHSNATLDISNCTFAGNRATQ